MSYTKIKGKSESGVKSQMESAIAATATDTISVMMVTAEAAPYAKVGGLGDVVGTLPSGLHDVGVGTSVFMPMYREVRLNGYAPHPTGVRLKLRHAGEDRDFKILSLEANGVTFFFIEEPGLFDREWVYGPPGGEYPDSAVRFSFLCRGSLLAAKALGLSPRVVHCHDWHASLVPLYMKHGGVDPGWRDIPTLLTIHNLAYQGQFGPQVFPSLGLGREVLESGVLKYWGNLNFLKGGILTADAINTVSPTYAEEIRTPEQGCGLDAVLTQAGARLRGILNGLDYEVWNPATDEDLVAAFSSVDPSARRINREGLQRQLRLYPIPEAPVFAFVGRLVRQKGVDILARVVGEMAEQGMQSIILGSGEYPLEESLLAAARPHKGMISVTIGFNETLARRIYASSDFFLMPSRFEPCGLGQMIALRYGSLPIVRATGGLKDTVVDLDRDPNRGNGFVFEKADEKDLRSAVDRAARFFREGRIPSVLSRVMSEDHSWKGSAAVYAGLYGEILSDKREKP